MPQRPSLATSDQPIASLDPVELRAGLEKLLQSYQCNRSPLCAWMVVHYAEALWQHPDFEGPDEQRCAYQRLAAHWRWRATLGGRSRRRRRTLRSRD